MTRSFSRTTPVFCLAANLTVCGSLLADVPAGAGAAAVFDRQSIASAGPGSRQPQFKDDDQPVIGVHSRLPLIEWGNSTNADAFPIYSPSYPNSLIPSFVLGTKGTRSTFFALGVFDTTLGHGSLVSRYTNSPNGHDRTWGVAAGFASKNFEITTFLGDVADLGETVGARIAVKPLMWLYGGSILRQPIRDNADWIAAPYSRLLLAGNVAWDREGALDLSVENQLIFFDHEEERAAIYLDVNPLRRLSKWSYGVHAGAEAIVDGSFIRASANTEIYYGSANYIAQYFDQLYATDRTSQIHDQQSKLKIETPAHGGFRFSGDAALKSRFWLPTLGATVDWHDRLPTKRLFDQSAPALGEGIFGLGAYLEYFIFRGSVTAQWIGIGADRPPGNLTYAELFVSPLSRWLRFQFRAFLVRRPDQNTSETGGNINVIFLLGV